MVLEIMNPIEFACFFEKFQRSIGHTIDTDIVGKIYEYYEDTYDNYTLLELISILSIKNITIDCEFNKKSIIKMIKTKNIDIPTHHGTMKPTSWWMEEGERYNYIFAPKMYFAFYEGDIFKTQEGIVWELMEILQEIGETLMYFKNKDNGNEICILADDFMYSLDYHDTTIIYNSNMHIKNIM